MRNLDTTTNRVYGYANLASEVPLTTCESLKLNIEEAMKGRTWLLLPEGYRAAECGNTYPLPTARRELSRLIVIPIAPRERDSGQRYIRRARAAFEKITNQKLGAALKIESAANRANDARQHYTNQLLAFKREAKEAVDAVRAEAEKQIANLNELMVLGREGIEGQMRAHLAGEKWKDETISARDFRQCFAMVTTAIKGLGVPSDERKKAQEAIFQEAAASIESTREAVSMAPGAPAGAETEH